MYLPELYGGRGGRGMGCTHVMHGRSRIYDRNALEPLQCPDRARRVFIDQVGIARTKRAKRHESLGESHKR